MTSKRQQNAGYLLPDPVTGYDTICLTLQIPNERRYRAAVVGHLYQLANWWTWEKSYVGNDTRARDAAAMFRRLLVDTLILQECGSGGTPVVSNPGCVPIGSPFMLFVNVAPDGALPMDGVERLQADYPDLMPMIPSSWKSGASFTLPDMASRGLFGAGSVPGFAANAGQTFGEVAHTLTEAELPPHAHQQTNRNGVGLVLDNANSGSGTGPVDGVAGAPNLPLMTQNTGGGQAHYNMPPGVAGYWFIQATNCESAAAGDFDIRLSGCLLEYTLNGSMWFVVDGWTNLDNCLSIPLPFDLRFNNCLLEYSRDSAQTWNTVPGWADVAACIDTNETYDLRLEGGLLQWSKDGGQDWATVTGWTDGILEITSAKDRCLNAWGLTDRFCQLAAQMVQALSTEPTLQDYEDHCAVVWYAEFPELEGLPPELQQFVVQSFNVALRTEYIAKFEDLLKQEIVARYFFTASPAGEWCDENIDTFLSWLLCAPGITEDHVISVILLFKALLAAYDNAFGSRNKFRAYLYQWRDFGTCHECDQLLTVELCNTEPLPFACETDFSVSVTPWVIFYDVGATTSIDETGWKAVFAGSGHEFVIERSLPDGALSIGSLSKAEFTGGLVSSTHRIYARTGGTWAQIVSQVEYVSGQEVNLSASLPVGADAVRMSVRLDNTNTGTVWIDRITINGEALENPC